MGSRSVTFLNPDIVVSDRPWTTLLTCAHLQNLKVDTTTVTSAISMQSAGPSLTPADFLWSHSFSLFISFFVFVLTCCFKPHVHYSHSSLEITLTLRTLTLSSCHTQWCIAKMEVGIRKGVWRRAWRYPAYLWSLRWVYAVKKTRRLVYGVYPRIPLNTPLAIP